MSGKLQPESTRMFDSEKWRTLGVHWHAYFEPRDGTQGRSDRDIRLARTPDHVFVAPEDAAGWIAQMTRKHATQQPVNTGQGRGRIGDETHIGDNFDQDVHILACGHSLYADVLRKDDRLYLWLEAVTPEECQKAANSDAGQRDNASGPMSCDSASSRYCRCGDAAHPTTEGAPVSNETMTATRTIAATPGTVFAVLADPSQHAGIDGTGWVRESIDGERLTTTGQVFRVAMYHANHPDGHYEMSNRVEVLDPPLRISWQPGQDDGSGTVGYGGWFWRYDLAREGDMTTTVTLTYDWSAVPAFLREHIAFPPFSLEHLENSLAHLDELTTATCHQVNQSSCEPG